MHGQKPSLKTITGFLIVFCKNAKISPLPYLVSEFCAANTWSMMFVIGNPTNIYIASSFNIDFSRAILPFALNAIVEI